MTREKQDKSLDSEAKTALGIYYSKSAVVCSVCSIHGDRGYVSCNHSVSWRPANKSVLT